MRPRIASWEELRMLELKKIDYENALKMSSECEVFAKRARLLLQVHDYAGSLEANQHLIEWGLKALFALVGKFNKTIARTALDHDPLRHIDILENTLKPVFNVILRKNFRKEMFMLFRKWSIESSVYHTKAIYGSYHDEIDPSVKHTSASEMITLGDADQFLPAGMMIKDFISITILIFGHVCGFNSREREKELKERLEKALPGTTPEAYDLIKTVVRCTG